MNGDRHRQLLYVLQSGQPIVKGYRALGGRYRKVADLLERGDSLSAAVQQAGLMPLEQVLTTVGEQAGRLEDCYRMLADVMDQHHAYSRKLLMAVLRAVILAGVGAAGSWGLMKWLDLDIPLWWLVWLVVAFMILGLMGSMLSMIAPGWRGWIRLSSTRFMLISGVSFAETVRYLKLAGMGPGRGDSYAQLLRLSGNNYKLVAAAEEAGTTDQALEHLAGEAAEQMAQWKERLSRLMYYSGVIVAMATVLAGVLAFCAAGVGELGLKCVFGGFRSWTPHRKPRL